MRRRFDVDTVAEVGVKLIKAWDRGTFGYGAASDIGVDDPRTFLGQSTCPFSGQATVLRTMFSGVFNAAFGTTGLPPESWPEQDTFRLVASTTYAGLTGGADPGTADPAILAVEALYPRRELSPSVAHEYYVHCEQIQKVDSHAMRIIPIGASRAAVNFNSWIDDLAGTLYPGNPYTQNLWFQGTFEVLWGVEP